ncbi:MAG: ABC transporter substrate-binding protein [Phycisphaerae bacterium]
MSTGRTSTAVVSAAALAWMGCERTGTSADSTTSRVTVYCSIDESFGRSVLDRYRARTGTELSVIFDSEAGKTTGLVNRITGEARAGRPRADVFWSSELFNTIRLARQGLLEPYVSPAAADIPERFRDPQHRWTALAARARVLAFDPQRISRDKIPTSWKELASPAHVKTAVMANPLFGTTRGHVAAMAAMWGGNGMRDWLRKMRDGGMRVVDGNSAAVREVIAGRAVLALTDTDDVWVAQRSGASLDLCYPDMGGGGTILIPCSVAIIKGAPNLEGARRLVDFLISAEVERMLAQSESRNVPVRKALRTELNLPWPPESTIAYDEIVDAMPGAVEAVREILLR